MIYAYCLSVFSIHFFAQHNISKFKLRLINQQTGDCTDSIILNAAKLGADTFPVSIKLKGGERLLMKVKLLSLPSNSTEALVGEGVVNFDRTSIDNSLRVPIYDKQRGVEEVAICSIDFFLSGFQVEKHTSINPDKSRSRFDDWRDKTQDAVYSQMSYTLESEQGDLPSERQPVPIPQKRQKSEAKKSKEKGQPVVQSNQEHKTKNSEGKNGDERIINKHKREIDEKDRKKAEGYSEEHVSHFAEGNSNADSNEELLKPTIKQSIIAIPFVLQNNVYLDDQSHKKTAFPRKSKQKQLIKTKKKEGSQVSPSARSNQHNRKKIIFESMEEAVGSNPREESLMSPQQIKEKVKENEAMIVKLKKYLSNIEKDGSSPKHKRRRKSIKVEEFSAYNFQNNFVKYYQNLKSKPFKVMRNIKSIRIIENQIKEPSDEIIVPQIINKFLLSTVAEEKIVSFDMFGFRSYCIANNQNEAAASIQIPSSENALKVVVVLKDQGTFEGTIGLQEGEQMNIKLTKIDMSDVSSVLESSEFRLIFDIKAELGQKKSTQLLNIDVQNDVSYREPYDVLIPEKDIKQRVELLGFQPWGFVRSYAEEVTLSLESKRMLDKIHKELPEIKQSQLKQPLVKKQAVLKLDNSHQNRQATQLSGKQSKAKFRKRQYNQSQLEKARSISSKAKDYLQNSPIKKRKLKPIPTPYSENHEVDEINSIRNGNRNNYKFKDRATSKQIKEAWEEILFKRKLQEEKLKRKVNQPYKMKNEASNRKGRSILDALNGFNIAESDSQSIASNQSHIESKVNQANRLYEYPESADRKSAFPLRCLTLKISNVSITQPEAAIEDSSQFSVGKFVKFSIKDRVTYFTEVIFNGGYNSILWKLQGCLFEQLLGSERLEIQIYRTVNNRIQTLGKSEIRINRLYFLRSNHVYNGQIAHNSVLNGEFTIGFDIYEFFPFEVIQEEEEDTFLPKANAKKNHSEGKHSKIQKDRYLKTLGHQSLKYMKVHKNKGFQNTMKRNQPEASQEESLLHDFKGRESQMEQSMSMPMGIGRE